ncbi:LysM peptidoglycan-binding domain-containing protein [Nocardioides campestrisoli]|uniref:LysM peptidoglycan-binding domain-containing protein n=1 Tax=Nocardioides campestrisoli TaxID=2736757 RepID=UPI00163DA6E4|nr:LysM peptidoglycan-binding domain-containing protein [Nocardioides campestrisoli]
MNTLNPRLRGLAATLALIAFVAGVPTVLLAIDAIPDLSAFAWSRLSAPDDGTLVVEVLAAVCWLAWAIFTCQLAASIVSQLRGLNTPRLPGLGVPQGAADRLVAAAALLFFAMPSATALVPEPAAEAAAATTPLPATGHVAESVDSPAPAPQIQEKPIPEPEVERYTVKRGDSLWRIAEERWGDGTRYVELVDLNQAVLGGRPDFLLPGTVLKVPVSRGPTDDAYVVRPGDTLSEIAEDELGDADAYPSIFQASRDTAQADGARLTDPDLILPGWRLTVPVPGQQPTVESPAMQAEPRTSPRAAPESQGPATHMEPTEPAERPTTESQNTHHDTDDDVTPSWLLPGLAGAGSIFGGALWLVLRAQRRTQLRYRRPGTIIPPPPAELLPAEKTARATASVIAPRIDALDSALRSLSPLPRLVTVALTGSDIALTLAEPADLPTPWTGSATAWRIALADVPERPEDSFPPYPLLVSVGQRADNAFLFLNLEELRTVTVTGDTERKAAFARHLAAELAVNPWSIVTRVDLLGVGPDLAEFNLGRVHTHPADDTDFIATLARHLSSITEPSDPDDFHAAVIATTSRPVPGLDELADVIGNVPGRSSAAVIDLAAEPRPSDTHLHLTDDGRLQAPNLDVDVIAAGLSEDEARACALLLDLTLEETVAPVPRPTNDAPVADLGGALVEPLTEPRPAGAAGNESLLPLDTQAYTNAAATTVEDVEALAPIASPQARSAVRSADPCLDEDLALWGSPAPAARLTLLGPINVRTAGDAKPTVNRRPFYVELLTYLALHPAGVSKREVARDFAIRPERVRVDMSKLRVWLGDDPRTRRPYLPAAEGEGGASPKLYKLDGVLCDLDLFRRLRVRGQSRGAEGMDDLIAALRLVSGEPFSELRTDGWSWLLEGDRWDHIMTSAIVDVAHIVSVHALAGGDCDLALWSAQVAYSAAPYDEVAQLDLVQAEKVKGDDEKADRDLNENVFNRRDDELPPIELPERTAQVVRDKNWGGHGPRPRRTG